MRFRAVYILLAIVLFSLILRIWGINSGLPNIYHPDEERLVHHALAFGLGDLNPHYFNYPSFPMYFLFFEYGGYYLIGRLAGMFSGLADFQNLFFSDPSSFYLIGRLTSVLLGTVTVILVYILGRRAYGSKAGLWASFFFGITWLHVAVSHYVTTDILLTMFISASYIFIIDIFKTGRRRAYIWAGVWAGLGAASKYNAFTLTIPIVLAHWWGPVEAGGWLRRLFHKNLLISAGGMAAAFFLASPFCILDFPKFWADFSGIAHHVRVGVYSTGGGRHWGEYLALFFRDPMYFAPARWNTLGLIYASAIIWVLARRGKKEWLLFSYSLIYFLMVGSWGVCNARYLIPVFPTLAVLSGGMVAYGWEKWKERPVKRLALIGALLALTILPLRNIILTNLRLARTDTRSRAREWIEGNIPAGTAVALEWDNNDTVQLQETDQVIREKIRDYKEGDLFTIHHPTEQMTRIHRMRLEAPRGKTYEIIRIGAVDGLVLIPYLYDIDALKKRGVEYIVVSSSVYRWFMAPQGREKYPVHASFYDRLFEEYEPVIEFSSGESPGPRILIYRIGTPKKHIY